MSSATIPQYEEIPPASVARWGDPGHHPHTVQFYGEDSFLIDELSRFIGTHLVAGDGAVVIATPSHREALARRLVSRGLDTSKAFEQGRYVLLDAAETLAKFMRGGSPDPALFTQVAGSLLGQVQAAAGGKTAQIAAFGEMVAVLWAGGNAQAAVRIEQLWNDLAKNYPLSLRCAYPISGFDREHHSELFLKICSEHSHVMPVESYGELADEEQRLRSITHLQQKAQALETEVAERKQVEEALRHSKAELESQVEQRTSALRQLTSRLLSLQDTERRRIARELHDSLGQYLVGLKLNLDLVRRTPEREQLWSEADQLMQQCISEVRTLSYLLHPPTMDAAGFASAARWYVEGFGQRSGVEVTLDVPSDLGRLPDALELALFRVLQETLTNVHRHAAASTAHVLILNDAEQVVLQIKDNGHGLSNELLTHFHTTGSGMGVGLAGIRERARELGGKFELESDGNGTVVRITMPVSQTEQK